MTDEIAALVQRLRDLERDGEASQPYIERVCEQAADTLEAQQKQIASLTRDEVDPAGDAVDELTKLKQALTEAWIVMNYTGDVLNGHDMVEDRDKAICNPSLEIIRANAPWLEEVDLDAEYRKRWQEVIGTCRDCGTDIQWNDPHQPFSNGDKRCIQCMRAANTQGQIEEPRSGDEVEAAGGSARLTHNPEDLTRLITNLKSGVSYDPTHIASVIESLHAAYVEASGRKEQ